MLEIYINTDSLTPAADIYADADKSTSLGRRVPFVRGERGKLRVGFLGGNAPSEGAQVVLAVRAMDADKTELLRTDGATRELVGGVPVYELDFVVDTVELSAALEKAESLTLLAGVVVKEGAAADDVQNEWQFSMVISDTALRGNAPSPSPDPEPGHSAATLDGDNVFTGNNTFTNPVAAPAVENADGVALRAGETYVSVAAESLDMRLSQAAGSGTGILAGVSDAESSAGFVSIAANSDLGSNSLAVYWDRTAAAAPIEYNSSVTITKPAQLVHKSYVDAAVSAEALARFAAADSDLQAGSVHGMYLLASQNGEDGGFIVAGNKAATRAWTEFVTRYQRSRIRVYGAEGSAPEDFFFLSGDAQDAGNVIARMKDIPAAGGTLTVDAGNELNISGVMRWRNAEGNTAVSLRFTDSPTGGVLNQGSASTTTAMTWMSGNYMSWFSSEFLRMYSGESVISPTAKVEANPSGVILAAGEDMGTKIVVDSRKIQAAVSGSNVGMKLNENDVELGHSSANVYITKSYKDTNGSYQVDIVVGDGTNSPTTHSFHKNGLRIDRGDYQPESNDVVTKREMDAAIAGGGGGTTAIVHLSQAEYDALPSKDAETLYVITD